VSEALAMSNTLRITKKTTIARNLNGGIFTASRIKVMSATTVTPYVSKPAALVPTESPALSPYNKR